MPFKRGRFQQLRSHTKHATFPVSQVRALNLERWGTAAVLETVERPLSKVDGIGIGGTDWTLVYLESTLNKRRTRKGESVDGLPWLSFFTFKLCIDSYGSPNRSTCRCCGYDRSRKSSRLDGPVLGWDRMQCTSPTCKTLSLRRGRQTDGTERRTYNRLIELSGQFGYAGIASCQLEVEVGRSVRPPKFR
ncbi:hypothetical protein B0T21DRAFT_350880 [Apiosordaria backusii]|uniref:Uncharacterized protein n=1 Tax=Apiosordaria backusii TaxID=314023 RepID=A0AA40AXB7_9PEZI|nr:hypothetical protein B0T21DRAFT_350880 [Apiosordaria backusii]